MASGSGEPKHKWEEGGLYSDPALCSKHSNIAPDNAATRAVSIPKVYSCTVPLSSVLGNGSSSMSSSSSIVAQFSYQANMESAQNIGSGKIHKLTSPLNPSSSFQSPQESKANGPEINVDQVLVELQRERQKNAELLGRLSALEARLQAKTGASTSEYTFGQDDSSTAEEQDFKKIKRSRKEETSNELYETENKRLIEELSHTENQSVQVAVVSRASEDNIVNWMSRDELRIPENNGLKNDFVDKDADETYEMDDDSENAHDDNEEEAGECDNSKIIYNSRNGKMDKREGDGSGIQIRSSKYDITEDVQSSNSKLELDELEASAQTIIDSNIDITAIDKTQAQLKREHMKKLNKCEKAAYSECVPNFEIGASRIPSLKSSFTKTPKMAFCPKEVRRIMESGMLALKNAQSHTMRKIIVFASLGIRHGCEDMYELDFSHFTIMRKGEPYRSPEDPGEHVVYEQPGVRKKIFYPNRKNPILCPVCILEEEKAMRPSDPSCPSCFFLCIKYGGRTRNLPQNEYVRQRMGRNKLKSFGPLMCQMAFLVHIRTGSFFFKALGITLLFMAGFTDDVVRRETKYCNLDLLQKYYRPDEDAESEELFQPYPMFYPLQSVMTTPSVAAKGVLKPGRTSSKQQPTVLVSKPCASQTTPYMASMSSVHVSQSNFSHSLTNTMSISTLPRPYTMYPAYAVQSLGANYLPLLPWQHHVNAFIPNHFPAFSTFQTPHFLSHPSHSYYNKPIFPSVKLLTNKTSDSDESHSDSESTSSEVEERSNKSKSFAHGAI